MDAKALQARLDVARSFKHSIGHIEFRCRLIPQTRVAGIYERSRGSNMDAALEILGQTVLGMKGALASDMNLDGEEKIDDSRDSAMLLLEERQDIAIALASEIANRIAARSRDIGDDEKNSSSGSGST